MLLQLLWPVQMLRKVPYKVVNIVLFFILISLFRKHKEEGTKEKYSDLYVQFFIMPSFRACFALPFSSLFVVGCGLIMLLCG